MAKIESDAAYPSGIKIVKITNGILIVDESSELATMTYYSDEKSCMLALEQMWAEKRAALVETLNDHAMRTRR